MSRPLFPLRGEKEYWHIDASEVESVFQQPLSGSEATPEDLREERPGGAVRRHDELVVTLDDCRFTPCGRGSIGIDRPGFSAGSANA
jgi:hypothetical protein